MNKSILYVLIAIGFIIFKANAQTGVYYFDSAVKTNAQARVVDIEEAGSGKLVLINNVSDENYMNPIMQFLVISNKGTIELNKGIPVNNLYDLNSIKKINQNEFKVFGNLSVNKQYEPFQLTINSSGESGNPDKESSVFSTLTSHVVLFDGYYYILYTKDGKNERYNISLHKISVDKNVAWLKKISSEANEEADKVVVTKNGFIYILGKKYNDQVTDYLPIIYKLDAQGNQLWKKGIDVPNSFNNQSILVNEYEEIIYLCSYTKNPTGHSETKLMKVSDVGEEKNFTSINDFNSNGMILLKNSQLLLFGSKFYVDQKQVVTKGGYLIISQDFKEKVFKVLDSNDKPDIDLKVKSQTSSDFTVAMELTDGRIALGGKIFMPTQNSKKQNVPFLMLINADGTYNK